MKPNASACILALALAAHGPAQSRSEAPPAFAVASIKPQPWTNEGRVGVFVSGSTLTAEHIDLYGLVEFAYGLRSDGYQLSGGPVWARKGILSNVAGAESALYAVIAKADGSPPSIGQFRRMLQTLLADRFQLRVHHAMKDLPVYHLVLADDGSKLKASAADARTAVAMADGPPFHIRAMHVPLAKLVEELTDPNHGAGRPVFDRTGLTGFYDFEIEWSPAMAAGADPEGLARDANAPSLLAALRQRLGLKLQPAIERMDTVVIDYAARPTPN